MKLIYDKNWKCGNIINLDDDELRGIARMIEGASLPERQMFHNLKERLKEELCL